MSEIAFSRISALGVDTFVETGTFKGDSAAKASKYFDTVYTVEKSNEYAKQAAERFADDDGIEVIQGDATDVLPELAQRLSGDELYYLDAHYSDFPEEPHVAGSDDQCPLLDELDAIADAGTDGRIIIDDEFMFTKPPESPYDPSDWPSLSEVLNALDDVNPDLRLSIIGSYMIALPANEIETVRDIQRERQRIFAELSEKQRVECAFDSAIELGFVDPLRPKYHPDE